MDKYVKYISRAVALNEWRGKAQGTTSAEIFKADDGTEHPINRIPIKYHQEFKKKNPNARTFYRGGRDFNSQHVRGGPERTFRDRAWGDQHTGGGQIPRSYFTGKYVHN